jgi:uncharacterized protein YpmS
MLLASYQLAGVELPNYTSFRPLKMKNTDIELLKKHFSFLLSVFTFKLKEIKSDDYALYVKFLFSS